MTRKTWAPALRRGRLLSLGVFPIAALLLTSGSGFAGDSSVPRTGEANQFARVYLALRGCTSCAGCRSAIRQLVKGQVEVGAVSLDGDGVEITYRDPQTIPLREVIEKLAKNRLHDVELVDVIFEAEGTIGEVENGLRDFTISGTHQKFPLAEESDVESPPVGTAVRLEALVVGWREKKGTLSLALKSAAPVERSE